MANPFCSPECLKSQLLDELNHLAATWNGGPAATLAPLKRILHHWSAASETTTTNDLPLSLLYPVQRDVSTAGTHKDLDAKYLLGHGDPVVDTRCDIQFFFAIHGEDVYCSREAPRPLSLLELETGHQRLLEALRRVAGEADVEIMLSCAPRGLPLVDGDVGGRMYVDVFGHEYFSNMVFPRQEVLVERSDASEIDDAVSTLQADDVDWVSSLFFAPLKSVENGLFGLTHITNCCQTQAIAITPSRPFLKYIMAFATRDRYPYTGHVRNMSFLLRRSAIRNMLLPDYSLYFVHCLASRDVSELAAFDQLVLLPSERDRLVLELLLDTDVYMQIARHVAEASSRWDPDGGVRLIHQVGRAYTYAPRPRMQGNIRPDVTYKYKNAIRELLDWLPFDKIADGLEALCHVPEMLIFAQRMGSQNSGLIPSWLRGLCQVLGSKTAKGFSRQYLDVAEAELVVDLTVRFLNGLEVDWQYVDYHPSALFFLCCLPHSSRRLTFLHLFHYDRFGIVVDSCYRNSRFCLGMIIRVFDLFKKGKLKVSTARACYYRFADSLRWSYIPHILGVMNRPPDNPFRRRSVMYDEPKPPIPTHKIASIFGVLVQIEEHVRAMDFLALFIDEKLAAPNTHAHFVSLWFPLLADIQVELAWLRQRRLWPPPGHRLEDALRNTILAVVVIYAVRYVGREPALHCHFCRERPEAKQRKGRCLCKSCRLARPFLTHYTQGSRKALFLRRRKANMTRNRQRRGQQFQLRPTNGQDLSALMKQMRISVSGAGRGELGVARHKATVGKGRVCFKERMAWLERMEEGKQLLRPLVAGHFSTLVGDAPGWARLEFLRAEFGEWRVPFAWPMEPQRPCALRDMMRLFFLGFRDDYQITFSGELEEKPRPGLVKTILGRQRETTTQTNFE